MRISALKLVALAAPESSDADLLVRFVARRDEGAFEELVRRHGPAVLRICRRLVGPGSADDAFQAVFLVLACRARAVRKSASVGSWLIGVAGRVARQMRLQLMKRRMTGLGSQDDIADPSRSSPDSHLKIPELAAALDEELTRLPDALRAPVVLCLVEGRTQEQAAIELGGSLRTLRRRLDQAKALLRVRLERRGVVPAVIAALVCDMQTTSAVSPELFQRTVEGVFEFLAGGPVNRAAPAVIAKGVVLSMSTFKTAVLVPVVACVLVGLGVVWAQDGPGNKQSAPVPQPPAVKETGKDQSDQSYLEKYYLVELLLTDATKAPYRSTNFVVNAPTPTMARAIAAEAEYQRAELAKQWLGKELPAWDKPCEIRYTAAAGSGTGISTFSFIGIQTHRVAVATVKEIESLKGTTVKEIESQKGTTVKELESLNAIITSHVEMKQIELKGEFLDVLTNELPRNVMQVVLVTHFGKPLPKWAAEGLSIAAMPTQLQAQSDDLCRKWLNAGRGIRLRKFLTMADYPKDLVPALHAQAYSVVRFLLAEKATTGAATNVQKQFVIFLKRGMEENTVESWNKAAKTVYGFETVDSLEEAWLDYLKKPESQLKSKWYRSAESIDPSHKDQDFIPPTTLPGGNRPATDRP